MADPEYCIKRLFDKLDRKHERAEERGRVLKDIQNATYKLRKASVGKILPHEIDHITKAAIGQPKTPSKKKKLRNKS